MLTYARLRSARAPARDLAIVLAVMSAMSQRPHGLSQLLCHDGLRLAAKERKEKAEFVQEKEPSDTG
jgi:hypothetical protein